VSADAGTAATAATAGAAAAGGIVRVGATTGMSQATVAGGLVHVAGQVAWADGGDGTAVVGEHDSRAQADQVFARLGRVLAEAGCGPADVVKLTCYLTDAAHFGGYAAAKAAVFGDAAPASTTVVVAALLDPRLAIEVEAVAVRPAGLAAAGEGA
jgi:enamine deaminase RidA (YjgF/YER057c/UK114 family)